MRPLAVPGPPVAPRPSASSAPRAPSAPWATPVAKGPGAARGAARGAVGDSLLAASATLAGGRLWRRLATHAGRRGNGPWEALCTPPELSAEESQGWHAIGIYRGKSEMNHGTLWRSAYQMGAAFIFTVQARHKLAPGTADTTSAWSHLPCFRFDSFEQLQSSEPEACAIVAVEMGGQPLETFRHPPRAIYLLGAEDDGLPQKVLDQCHYHVSLPTVRSASMNVAAVGSTLLYDRLLKRMLLDPYPHAHNAKKPARRLAAAVEADVRRAPYMFNNCSLVMIS